MALMDSKSKTAAGFKKPDTAQFTPPELKDVVQRVAAAGVKLMYSPDMRDELAGEVQRDAPAAQKMAESVTGLLLTIDSQAKGGIPMGALFPAGLELLGEAGEVLTSAGQAVTQDQFNEAAQLLFVMVGKKLGASDEQLMQTAEQAAGGGAQEPAQPDAEAAQPEEVA